MLGRRGKKPPVRQGRVRPAPATRPGKVFSYYASRQTTDTTPVRDRNRGLDALPPIKKLPRITLKKRLQIIILAVAIGTLVFVNIFVNTAVAPKIIMRGTPTERQLLRDKKTYQSTALDIIQSSFTSRTKLTIDTNRIERELLKQFPELASVSVSLPLAGSTPTITLVPVGATFSFTASDGASYVMSDTGRIIAANGSDSVNLVPITDQSGLKVTLGSQALPSHDVIFLKVIHTQVTRSNIQIAGMVLPPSSREVNVRLQDKPYIVKFTLEGDAYQQAGAYIAVQKRLDAERKTPSQYIDARVGDRVYYK